MQALLEFISQFLNELKPWVVVMPWENGILVRAGRHIHSLTPGFHFRFPILDNCHTLNVKPRVVNLPHQSLKTVDGKNLAVSGALAYSVFDIVKTLNDVDDHEASLTNLSMGLIADYVANHPLAECTHDLIQKKVSVDVRREAKKWGIEIATLFLTDLCDHRAFRLLHDNQAKQSGPTLSISTL